MISIEMIIRDPNNPSEYYTIIPKDEKSIWINGDDGEGGEFDSGLFFKIIDKFYKNNF